MEVLKLYKRFRFLIIYFFSILSIISCSDTNEEAPMDTEMFMKITYNDSTYYYSGDSLSIYELFYYTSYDSGYYFTHRLADVNKMKECSFMDVYLNCMIIQFENIPYEQIQAGQFRFSADQNHEGIVIHWMDAEIWNNLVETYKESEEYIDCLQYAPDTCYCILYKGYADFLRTDLVDQGQNYINVTRVQSESIQRRVACPGVYEITVDTKVVEGNFNCKAFSRLDPASTSTISGSFRIRIHAPYNDLCDQQF